MDLQKSQIVKLLEEFQAEELQNVSYNLGSLIQNNFFNYNKTNSLLYLLEPQPVSIDQNNQIVIEDTEFEVITDSDDSGQPITIKITNAITDVQDIQNDELSNILAIIKQIQEPDCFNYEVQQYTFKKAEYCRDISFAKKGVQVALNTNTINKFIGIMYNFIELKSIQIDNSLGLDIIGSVTNSYVILHHGRPKKQLSNFLKVVNSSNSQKINKSNKILNDFDLTNKATYKCSYRNKTGYYANTCKLNLKNKKK
ncbi:11191_t:CDS:2 [Racocetra fulgida]|uniref:11191_t:CDS:1 n=1 Tax=Racocetra fulgida TaxID=60492 RepID=A0A9N8ZK36_9GLOM|nr:11191_t:CDS:2 [Racocetra fulgida]